MAERGVKARSVQPVFPANTFPTHYTLATGLYPDNHGIVDNSFYDAELGRKYSISDPTAVTDSVFYGGEPIWVTAEKQGVRAASYFWVGSEANIMGYRPSITKTYDGAVPYSDRIDSVIAWLNLPEYRRPRLIMFYFEEPDGVGHDYGPGSDETKETLQSLDSLIGDLNTKIAQLPIGDKVNVIVTSDHGMTETSEDRVIYLDDYLEDEWQRSRGWTTFDPVEGYHDSILIALKDVPHLRVWPKSEIPDYLHYGSNPRVPPIVAALDERWYTGRRYQNPERYNGGSHGYDPTYPDMHVIFYAYGPAFKSGYIHPGFESVSVYSLIAAILGLDPAETDGSFNEIKDLLKDGQL